MYAIAWAVDLPSKIGDLEVLVLIVSCICHDLDHPGYNNIYQINARTELALRYNDISPLENHHCSMAFRVLEAPECNILASLDNPTYRIVREGIIRCILATDMARHNEILAQFTDIIPEFDYTSKAHINLVTLTSISKKRLILRLSRMRHSERSGFQCLSDVSSSHDMNFMDTDFSWMSRTCGTLVFILV